MKLSYENNLKNWVNKEKVGVSLLKSCGTLMYEHGIELVLFRNKLLEIGVNFEMSFPNCLTLGRSTMARDFSVHSHCSRIVYTVNR